MFAAGSAASVSAVGLVRLPVMTVPSSLRSTQSIPSSMNGFHLLVAVVSMP